MQVLWPLIPETGLTGCAQEPARPLHNSRQVLFLALVTCQSQGAVARLTDRSVLLIKSEINRLNITF